MISQTNVDLKELKGKIDLEVIMKDKYHEPLSEWQERNCASCKFSDKKVVGTGKACCTYCGLYELDDKGECKTRR